MAIKSKSKGRSKPRQVARAPRREPVPVPTPFIQRRWVQALATFLLGVLAVMLLVWVTNGLRQNDAESTAAAAAATKRKAASAYQTAVEGAFGSIGVVNQGVPPSVFPQLQDTLKQMAKGDVPKSAAEIAGKAASDAKATETSVGDFDVASAIAGQGFNETEASAFTGSSQQLILSMQLSQRCAEVAKAAATGSGAETDNLTGVAQGLCDSAQSQLTQGWANYLVALRTAGIVEAPGGTIPGLPGGGS
jgi:hypothetical protein